MRKVLLLSILSLLICFNDFSQEDQKGKKKDKKSQQEAPKSDDMEEKEAYQLEDESGDDNEYGNSNFVPSILHSSSDVYTNNTSYAFSIAYFRPRGYDNRYQEVFINGKVTPWLMRQNSAISSSEPGS